MRRLASTLGCLLLASIALAPGTVLAGQPALQPAQTIRVGHDLSRLQSWLDAADRHVPGQADAAALLVGSWSIRQLETVFFDLTALLRLVRSSDADLRLPRPVRAFSPRELLALRDLVTVEVQRAGLHPSAPRSAEDGKRVVNRLVKRGTLLHTDVALLVDAAADKLADSTEQPLLLAPRSTLHLMDARQVAVDHYGSHWDMARLLLDQVLPAPAADLAVRDWYHAVAELFATKYLLAESREHLARATRIFPADPQIALAFGRLREVEGSSKIQGFLDTATRPELKAITGSARSNLRAAQSFYRKAVALDGDSADASMHLGRVTGLLGRHEEAAQELRRAATRAVDMRTQYYAWLFLGVEEQALDHADQARESFERAAALYPRAQSPFLALSHLARRRGDLAGGRRAIEQVFARAGDDRGRADPWVTYFAGIMDPDVLLSDIRAVLFLAGGER
jgi:tetratricopeptide (TPR) repeat protein